MNNNMQQLILQNLLLRTTTKQKTSFQSSQQMLTSKQLANCTCSRVQALGRMWQPSSSDGKKRTCQRSGCRGGDQKPRRGHRVGGLGGGSVQSGRMIGGGGGFSPPVMRGKRRRRRPSSCWRVGGGCVFEVEAAPSATAASFLVWARGRWRTRRRLRGGGCGDEVPPPVEETLR
jgi:hypothetical protein